MDVDALLEQAAQYEAEAQTMLMNHHRLMGAAIEARRVAALLRDVLEAGEADGNDDSQ